MEDRVHGPGMSHPEMHLRTRRGGGRVVWGGDARVAPIGVKLRGLEPFPGRPQVIAPTIHDAAPRATSRRKSRRSIVGAIPCGRPLPSRSRLFSLHLTPIGLYCASPPFPSLRV